MIIIIDTEILKKFNITPDEYVILYEYYQTGYCIFEKSICDNLILKGFLSDKFAITTKSLELLNIDSKEWDEYFKIFWNLYPHKTSSRILRTESLNTLQGKKCKEKFKKTCYNSLSNCNRVIKGLTNQINIFKGTKEFDFFQNIETWLNNNTWEKYETILETKRERVEGIN